MLMVLLAGEKISSASMAATTILATIQWSKSDETEIMPFEVGRRVIKIPDATDAVTGYKCTKRDGGYYDESVTIDGVRYIYVSDSSGLKGIMCEQVCYVEIKGITRCPASNDFLEPNIK